MAPRFTARLMLLVLPMAVLAAPAAIGQESLRWKFKEGESHQYTLEQKTENTAMVQGQEITTTILQTVEMTWAVKSVEADGSARVAQTIDRIKMELNSPFAGFAYDSQAEQPAEGPAAQLAPVINALIGTPITLLMNPRGEVNEVEVPDEMVQKLQNAGPAAQSLKGLASKEGMKGLIGQSTLVLPEEPVSQGDNWTRKLNLPMPTGTMALTNTYTYEGTGEQGLAKINLKMNIDELKAAPDAPFEMKLDSQEGSGSYSFDTQAGILKSSEVNQKLKAVVTLQGQEITTEANSTATFSLSEK